MFAWMLGIARKAMFSRTKVAPGVDGLLAAAAACVILLSFTAGHRKSYWSGCIEVAIVICQQIFALVIFLLKFLLKSASIFFFSFGAEIRFWSRNFCPKASLCKSFSESATACVCTSFCV